MDQLQDIRVLVVDDDPIVRVLVRLLFYHAAKAVDTEGRADLALARLQSGGSFDVVLLHVDFIDGTRDGTAEFELLDRVRRIDPAVAVVLMTTIGDEPLAVEAMQRGAADFVVKPGQHEKLERWHYEKLFATVLAAAALARSRRAVARL